jgi:phage-related protein
MSDLPPISQKVGMDTTEFKTGIAALSREIKVIETGFRATAATMADWANNATGLEARSKALTSEIGAQTQKVALLQAEYNRMAASGKEDNITLENMQIDLNKATEALNRMVTESAATTSTLEKLAQGPDKVAATMDNLGARIQDVESRFRASAASIGNWSNSTDGLRLRLSALSKEMDYQEKKVELLHAAYLKSVQEEGDYADETLKLSIALNKETESLNKMQSELNQSKTTLNQLETETGKTSNRMDGFKKVVSGLGSVLSGASFAFNSLKTVASGLGSVLSGAGRAIEGLKKAASGMGSALSGVGRTIGGLTADMARLARTAALTVAGIAAAGVAAAVAFGAKTVEPASALNESINKSKVVFKEYGDSILDWSKNSATAFGLSRSQALDAAGGFGAMFGAMGIAPKASMDMSKGLVKLAADMGSLYNVNPSEMLEKLRSGMAGEAEPLRVFGVMLSEANVQAKALEMGLGGSGRALTDQEKALARYALIQEQAAVANNDFTNTAGGWANLKRIISASLTDLRAKIGTALLPALNQAGAAFKMLLDNPKFQEGVSKLIGWISQLATTVTQVIAKLQTGDLRAALDQVFGAGGAEKILKFKDSIGGIAGKIGSLVGAFKSGGISGLFKELFSGIDLGSIAGNIGELIGKLLTSMAVKPAQILRIGLSIINGLATGITGSIPTLLPMAMQLLTSLVGFITQSLPILMTAGFQILNGLIMGILPMLPMLLTTASYILMGLVTGIVQTLPTLIPAAIAIILQLALMLAQNLPMLIQAGIGLLASLMKGIMAALPQLLKIGLSIINGLATGITSAIPTLLPMVMQLLTSLISFITQSLPILMTAGFQILTGLIMGILPMLPMLLTTAMDILMGLATGITQALPTLIPAAIQIILQLVLMLVQNLPMLLQAGMGLLIALINGIMAALPTLLIYAPMILQALVDAFFTFLPILGSAALMILGAICNGIIGALPSLGVAVVQILGTLNTTFNTFWPHLLDLGKQIVMGIYQGILNNTDFFFKGVKSFFKNLIDQAKMALGIASPSKVFAEIGGNIALGLGVGFGQQMRDVQRQITGSMSGLGDIAFSGAGTGGSYIQRNQNNETFNNYGTYIGSLSPSTGGDNNGNARRW